LERARQSNGIGDTVDLEHCLVETHPPARPTSEQDPRHLGPCHSGPANANTNAIVDVTERWEALPTADRAPQPVGQGIVSRDGRRNSPETMMPLKL